MHSYKTLRSPSTGEYKEKGSKFIAYAYPVYNETDIKEQLDVLKKEHHKARHHCYAYRLGTDKNDFRANDDGEPSGSAGKPILGRIDSFELSNVLIVVVRYFGGTKLGVSGLIQAYKASAEDAINNGLVIEEDVKISYKLQFPYIYMNEAMGLMKKLDVEMVQQEYNGEECVITAMVKSKDIEGFLSQAENITELKIKQLG